MILVVLVYAVLASTFTLAKAALDYAKPFFLIGFRMIMAGTLLLGYLAVTDKKSLYIKKSDMVKKSHYKNIALPNDLIERIDSVIKNSKMGYKTRGEFVKEAVRALLKQLK